MNKVKCVFLLGLILFLNLLSLNSITSFQSTNPLESVIDIADDPLKVGTTNLGYDLDPAFANDRASHDIIDQVWEGLYAHNLDDPRLRIIPRLAADCGSWNENATVFNVTLRSGVTFHNGEAFTAADVNYTFSRLWQLCVSLGNGSIYEYYSPNVRRLYFPNGFNTTEMNASVGYGYIINKTVIVDDLHVSFELNFPYSPFQSLLCFSGSYIMDETTTNPNKFLEFANINNGTAIGTGPYKITEHTPDKCTFEYWEDYYRGVPAIKKINYQKFTDPTEISQALLEGDIDLPRIYNPDFISEFEKTNDIYVGPYRDGMIFRYLSMNNLKIDRIYRQAINYAIDYEKIINEIYNENTHYGTVRRMTSIIPSGITYHKDCEVPIFNITKSRQILIEAGYTEGYDLDETSPDNDWKDVAESDNPIITISYVYMLGSKLNGDIGVLIRDNLKDIGIRINLAGISNPFFGQLPWSYHLSKLNDECYITMISLIPDYNDPSQVINVLMSNTSYYNFAQVNDPWLQLAMEEALTIINEVDRKALYYDIQDYIATDLMPYASIVSSSIQNVRANYVLTQPNPMNKLYIFPFSWHGVNTSFNDPYLELWCNSGSPPVLEFWPEPNETISSYPILLISIFSLVIIPFWIQKNKKKLR